VISLGQPAAVDYVDQVCRGGSNVSFVSNAAACAGLGCHTYPVEPFSLEAVRSGLRGPIAAVVVFLPRVLTDNDRHCLDALFALAGESHPEVVVLVSTFRCHLGDRAAMESEAFGVRRAEQLARVRVLRPGHLLSRHSRAQAFLRQRGWIYPLLPSWLRSCCIDGEELFAAIESERAARGSKRTRACTLLGPCVAWRERLRQYRSRSGLSHLLTILCSLVSVLGPGSAAALLLGLLAGRQPWWRALSMTALRPSSFRELLTLYNRYNYRHVKVVGYNNGIHHFGHRYPGKAIVSTVGCKRVVSAGPDRLKADGGATVRRALDYLAATDRELPVVPNFSYVCLGTAFFVPIHGSAADFSTIGETITRVILYDPLRDRVLRARRHEPAFRKYAYNLKADVLLLRLVLRSKPRSRYYVHREIIEHPGGQALVRALHDCHAANVEIRKASATSRTVTLSRYYNDPKGAGTPVLELPRDALGRLWDRLEENPLSAFLMHALTRHFAWHVELFFTPAEFVRFWEMHHQLPLRKIQVRYIRQDGLPHSAFRDHDCVSVDLFMLRRHRRRFETCLGKTFGTLRTNPGKHSR
jgi:hypothetical protein